MAWLVAKVYEDWESKKPIAIFSRRHRLGDSHVRDVEALLAKNGYEGMHRFKREARRSTYPMFAVGFVSRNREGVGRIGTLWRLVVRPAKEN